MAFVILFGGMNFYYGIIGLVNMGYSKKKFVACVESRFFSLVLCSLLSIVLKDRGAAISMIVSEILLLILIWKELKKNRGIIS